MTGSSEFERLLDAQLAGTPCPPPFGPPPLYDSRPDPAIRFAMWGGGVPPLSFGTAPWPSAKVRGVSPWVDDADVARPDRPTEHQTLGVAEPGPVRGFTTKVASPRPFTPRPRRQLDEEARAALDLLRRSGAASLDEAFSQADLKAAYRRLAFRFHPDQHPSATGGERARLSQSFASISAAYRRLATL